MNTSKATKMRAPTGIVSRVLTWTSLLLLLNQRQKCGDAYALTSPVPKSISPLSRKTNAPRKAQFPLKKKFPLKKNFPLKESIIRSEIISRCLASPDSISVSRLLQIPPGEMIRAKELSTLTDRFLSRGSAIKIRTQILSRAEIINVLFWLFSCWTKQPHREMKAVYSEKLLRDVILRQSSGNRHATLSAQMFKRVIAAWSKTNDVTKVMDVLRLMEDLHLSSPQRNPKPTLSIYNTAMDALARSCGGRQRDSSASSEAERIMNDMEAVFQIRPNFRTFRGAISCHSRSSMFDPQMGEKAQRLLHQMEEEFDGGILEVGPNAQIYNSVIKSWATSGTKGAAERAENVLQIMLDKRGMGVEPDSISFTMVLMAWAKSGEKQSSLRARSLLERMERLYENGNCAAKPDTVLCNVVLDLLSRSSESDAGEMSKLLLDRMENSCVNGTTNIDIRPDTISYNSVINAFANSRHSGSGAKAEEILSKMETLYSAGNRAVKPSTISYNSVIKAYSKSGDENAGNKAEDMLDKMEEMYNYGTNKDVRPDLYSYNTVIHCYANRGTVIYSEKAERILERMESNYRDGSTRVKPDILSYNSVLNAWSKTREQCAPYKAEIILEGMIDHPELKPDVLSFTTVINAWSKSKEPTKAQKALDNLYRMETLNVKPNVFSYTAVLNACAFTYAKKKDKITAMGIAIETMGKLHKSNDVKPNHISYSTFLRACSTLMPAKDNKRDLLVQYIFQKCCRDGLCDGRVLTQFGHAASRDLYRDMLGDFEGSHGISLDTIPNNWKCNVMDEWQGVRPGNNKRSELRV